MLPVFTATESFDVLRRALDRERVIMVCGAVNPAYVAELAQRAAKVYAAWDAKTPGAAEAEFHHGHVPFGELGEIEPPPYVARLIKDGFHSTISDRQVRRILPPGMVNARVSSKIALHQDEYFGQLTVGRDAELPLSFTIWMPLVDCGVAAPGLSVVLGSREPIVKGKPREGWALYIWRRYGFRAIWSPAMNAGDLLVFTSRTIHGSYVRPHMTDTRYSIEIRGDIH